MKIKKFKVVCEYVIIENIIIKLKREKIFIFFLFSNI